MARSRKNVVFEGLAGPIDAVIDWPDGTPKGWALVLHPHSLQGGTRDNKVVTTIARASVHDGLVAVRPNFRGVGQSAGAFDHADGETADMLELIRQFAAEYPEAAGGRWLLGGFSFGTAVAARVYQTLAEQQAVLPDALILAGAAVSRFSESDIPLPSHTILVHGEDDDVVPLDETMILARKADLPVVVVPNAGHFFHGKLTVLKDIVEQRLKTM
ncbi:MAG TPA: alpha/beta hydrolase [Burkholderiaceae bacterium]|nr:alpha/beta hydrolase [Burkholderiaceae bacterium]